MRAARRNASAYPLQPRDEEFALEDEFFREIGVDFYEELVLGDDFFAPFFGVDVLESFESLVGEIFHFGEVECPGTGNPAEGSFFSGGATVTAVYDPFEDAHVLAEAGPHKFSGLVFAEPVDMENARRTDDRFSHVHPM